MKNLTLIFVKLVKYLKSLIVMQETQDIIVEESNLLVTQKHAVLNTTPEEIRAFIGILIFMGYHDVPTIRLYWSTNHNFFCPRIANVMPLKRFLKLLRYIHLNDNQKMLPRSSESIDKLFKIRPLIDHLNNIYKILYNPSQNLSVDESMVAYTGRSTMKQYMPLKPIKRGFKVWAMTDSATGYLLSFDVYTDIDLFGCGTFCINKKFYPKHLMKKDSLYKPGEIEFAQSEDVSVCRWKDRGKKPVTVISNMHDALSTEIVHRKNSIALFLSNNVPSESTLNDQNIFEAEIEKYIQIPKADLDSDHLALWKIYKSEFPNLSLLSRKYLCIQGTNVPCERLFCYG
ncbi:uncharacterized protein LOC112591992, partial [Melanaphis sacchari]|uniref:uncharacterized protein LOC112591992 n=1 Tax=Melanaphis sacchari TaxID=742174 RepID=UPI000DC13852